MDKVTVRVPASSANLGPGFDSIGCAFALYNTITFTKTKEGLSFSGCDSVYANSENLAYTSFCAVAKKAGKPVPCLHIDFTSTEIPVSRGLGSSAVLICAGAVAANVMLDIGFSKRTLLGICLKIERHPDNLSPCLMGGLVASVMTKEEPISVCYDVHPSLNFVALIPNFKLSTELARSVLPHNIPFKDAVYNISHTAVLLKAFELGDKDALRYALKDRLHQYYRKDLIEDYETVKDISKQEGCLGFFLSGAGPTCICVCDDKGFADKIRARLTEKGIDWQILPLEIDRQGTIVL